MDYEERSEVETSASPGDTFEAKGGICDIMDTVGNKLLQTESDIISENLHGATKSDQDNFEILEADLEILENSNTSPDNEIIDQFEKLAFENITEQDSNTIEPEPDTARWNEKIIKGSVIAIGTMAASAVVLLGTAHARGA